MGYVAKVFFVHRKRVSTYRNLQMPEKINGEDVVIAIMDSGFLMGSMGVVVGEKITYAIEQAIQKKLPLIIFSSLPKLSK